MVTILHLTSCPPSHQASPLSPLPVSSIHLALGCPIRVPSLALRNLAMTKSASAVVLSSVSETFSSSLLHRHQTLRISGCSVYSREVTCRYVDSIARVGECDSRRFGVFCRRAVVEGPEAVPPSENARRRTLLLLPLLMQGSAVAAAQALPKPDVGPEVLRVFRTPSGAKVQEVVEGTGPEAKAGDLVEFHYVCRRANGYYVYSTQDQFSKDEQRPVSFSLGQGQMIAGLEEVLLGMRPGGKRRALIPATAGYVSPQLQPLPSEYGPLRSLQAHSQEPLVFEVQLVKVR
eukprot:TRINITY_DN19385_c0_g1_i1.p1 TRINITY_DN19385_c0_g1~~TRINITY_DN19385_c0_g1_i1.p1  ORF type:complete len:289 (+),score=27.56 TRINITY_DN19385_c0_g1_i1:169-1035(+)